MLPISVANELIQLNQAQHRGARRESLAIADELERKRQANTNLSEESGCSRETKDGPAQDPNDMKCGRRSQATILVELAAEAILFRTPEDEAYAMLEISGHRETWSLKSRGFRDWLTRRFYIEQGRTPNRQAIQDALAVLLGKARFDGAVREVHIRVAEHRDAIYIDLADKEWRIVRIDGNGWNIIASANAPVNFRRTRGLLPLPLAEAGGTLDELRRFVNVGDERDWTLLLAWLVASLRPNRPTPLLALYGAQGCAKSTTARVLSSLIDPCKAALRCEPRDERDLMIATRNHWCMNFDNLSHISSRLSDSLCRLATGGGLTTRELYTDDEEVIFDALRPVIVNGIEDLATRGDLLSRAIVLYLPTIENHARRKEADFWEEFEEARGRIMGALYSAVSTALRRVSEMKLDSLPRMADFAAFGAAAEVRFGVSEGTFLAAYAGNRKTASTTALDDSPLTEVLVHLSNDHRQWKGRANELLKELNLIADEEIRRAKAWPKGANALTNRLRRLEPSLREIGIAVHVTRNKNGSLITISALSVDADPTEGAEKRSSPPLSSSSITKIICTSVTILWMVTIATCQVTPS